jgi:hypothetical protein
MPKMEVKNFGSPDELRNFDKGKLELLNVGGRTLGRAVFQPGWRWTRSLKAVAKTDSCQAPHVNYHVSGVLHIVMDNGDERDCKAGDISVVPPGHDAWVVGNEPVVVVDFQGMVDYAKQAKWAWMIILVRLDYEGDDLKNDLKKMNEVHGKIEKAVGGKIEGPYFPQQSTLLYIFHVDKYERLNEAGRVFYSEVSRLKLAFVPNTYEVAVTPQEFFGWDNLMKFLLRLHMPTESGNKMLQDPNFPKKLESVLNQVKPEAVYFAPIEGERGIYMIVNLPSADMIAGIAEPLWTTFNCKLDLTPVMELSDLQTGLQKR